MTEPRYPYVAVDVPPSEVDDAAAILFELGAGGVEERDATTLVRASDDGSGRITLIASFDALADAESAIAELSPAWSPRLQEVVGDAWRDEWKRHFEPFPICTSIVVRPPWRAYDAGPGERVIELEPGRAFGTGLHETTSLVAELLAERTEVLRGARVLDVGCGSGVLALVALVLGADTARAVDIDPDAVAVTRENAERNGLAARVATDTTPAAAIDGTFPVVLANIESVPLVELAPALVARVAPGGTLILSGILAPSVAPAQLASIEQAYGALGIDDVRQKGEWIAVVLSSRT